jgi:RimJ/RimL family protein N-acetyltransferase
VPESPTKEELSRFIESRERARQSGTVLPLVIAAAQDDGLLGTVSLMALDWEQHRGDVGFWIASWARGQGVATRAVHLLFRWALTELGLAGIQLCTYVDNHASQRVAERCGFVREGVMRAYLVRGRRHDVVMFPLLSDEPIGTEQSP